MTEPSKTNNFNGPMSAGAISSDHAQVSHNNFQQINNANTEELLKLITTLCQTAANFPAETKEEIDADIEDLEAEIIKPECDRSLIKIRKRLIAIATAASLIAGGVAGVTDFTNTAIELGKKFNIDVPALVSR